MRFQEKGPKLLAVFLVLLTTVDTDDEGKRAFMVSKSCNSKKQPIPEEVIDTLKKFSEIFALKYSPNIFWLVTTSYCKPNKALL